MRLNNILTREQEAAGLTLYDDEDIVYLQYREKTVALWYATRATPETIQSKVQDILSHC